MVNIKMKSFRGRLTLGRVVPFVAAATVGGLFLARPARSADPAAPAPIVIALANPAKIAMSLHETQDMLSKMDLDKKALQSTVQEKQQNIKALQQQLSYLKPDSPAYPEAEDKLLKSSIEYDAWLKETDLKLQRQQKAQIKNLFNEIEDAVAQIAQKKGINLVIADQRPDIPESLDQLDANTLRQLISQRTVLYSDQSRDISGEVTTLLDQNYANRTMPH